MIDVRCNARTASEGGSARGEQRCQLYAGHGSLHAALAHGDESAAGASRTVVTWRAGQPAGHPAEVHDASHAAGLAWAPGFPAFEVPACPGAECEIPVAEAAVPLASDDHTADIIALHTPKRRSRIQTQATTTATTSAEASPDEADVAEVADGSATTVPVSTPRAPSQAQDRPGSRRSHLSSA